MGCISSKPKVAAAAAPADPPATIELKPAPAADQSVPISVHDKATAASAPVVETTAASAPVVETTDAVSVPVVEATAASSHVELASQDQSAAAPERLPGQPDAAPGKASGPDPVSVFDPKEPFADPEDPAEVPVLDLAMAMEQVGNDQAFLLELIRDTLNERDKLVQEMNDAIQANDTLKCRMVAHTIKGSAVNVGLKSLSRRAKIIERFCDCILDGSTQESLSSRGSSYIAMIKEEYSKIERVKNERFS